MKFGETPIIYVTKDKERAGGVPEGNGYSILSGDGTKSTLELLQNSNLPEGSRILVFKNSMQIEELAKEKNWELLNPSAKMAEKVENKITQVEWLGDLVRFLPEHRVAIAKDITMETSSFILQWAHSHTGDGTFLIQKESELKEIQKQFPNREARITEYVKGPVFTMNITTSKDGILLGNISYQITGLPPFTDNPMSTIGNDWSLPHSILSPAHVEKFNEMALSIGEKMRSEGWRGLFGIDAVYDEERDRILLIEINSRQPASATFESELQSEARAEGVPGITMFEAHLLALTDAPASENIMAINDGSQIVQRVTKATTDMNTGGLEKAGYKVIKYNNTKLNSDRLRIQSRKGIMEAHNKFNARGKEIEKLLK